MTQCGNALCCCWPAGPKRADAQSAIAFVLGSERQQAAGDSSTDRYTCILRNTCCAPTSICRCCPPLFASMCYVPHNTCYAGEGHLSQPELALPEQLISEHTGENCARAQETALLEAPAFMRSRHLGCIVLRDYLCAVRDTSSPLNPARDGMKPLLCGLGLF